MFLLAHFEHHAQTFVLAPRVLPKHINRVVNPVESSFKLGYECRVNRGGSSLRATVVSLASSFVESRHETLQHFSLEAWIEAGRCAEPFSRARPVVAGLAIPARGKPSEEKPRVLLPEIIGWEGEHLTQRRDHIQDPYLTGSVGLAEEPPARPSECIEPSSALLVAKFRVLVGEREHVQHVHVAGVREPDLSVAFRWLEMRK
jgi:hypothetical protein